MPGRLWIRLKARRFRSILTVEKALGPKIRAYASTGPIMIAVNRPTPSICSLGAQSNAAAENLMT